MHFVNAVPPGSNSVLTSQSMCEEKIAKMKMRVGTFLWKILFQQHSTFLGMIIALEDIQNLQVATRIWVLLFTFYPVLLLPYFVQITSS